MDFIKIKGVLITLTIFSLTLGEVWGVASFAQNVGINTTGNAPNSSALLDINASPGNDKGILIPRLPLTATNVGTPISPAPGAGETGLMVFNTATAGVPPNDVVPGFYYWNGTAWAPLGAGGSTAGGWTDDGTVVRLTTSTDFVGIGTASPASTSALDITSTTKGILIPRMTTAQRDAITTPASGLQIYNTDCKMLNYWSGTCWISMSKALPSPGAITSSGTTVFCAGQSRTYSVAAVPGATTYTWTVPAGTVITSGQGTTSIGATFGNISGSVCVDASNSCETSPVRCIGVSVDPIPNTPGNITGPSSVNPGQQSVNYFIASVNGASAYTWAYSGTGLTIASGTGTTSIVVNFACNATAGNLTVTANSTCGASTASSLALTITPLLAVSAGAAVYAGAAIGNTATGGTSTYNYSWSPTADLSNSTIASPTALCTGTTTTYTVTVTDSRSCTATSTVVVTRDLTATTAGTHTASGTQIIWNWTAAAGATGYKWSATNNFSTATDMLTSTSKTETGLTSGTAYTRYVWSYNVNNCASTVTTLAFTTYGQVAYTTPGTYSWTCPAGVTSVCVVAVGGGGGGGYQWSSGGGGGGGLGWKNSIPVTPGTAYTVVVGVGGPVQANATTAGTQGGNSYFISLATVAGYGSGRGGTLGETTVSPAYGGGYNGDGGGSGGRGAVGGSWTHAGAGAGGYAGNGGSLNTGTWQGAGGGGAAGGNYSSTYGVSAGGGTGLLGQGANGTTRYDPANGWASTYGGGNGGSGGTRGKYGEYNGGTNECSSTQCITGGAPGGGGGGSGTSWGGGAGGAGGLRIIWGAGRSFPSTNTADY